MCSEKDFNQNVWIYVLVLVFFHVVKFYFKLNLILSTFLVFILSFYEYCKPSIFNFVFLVSQECLGDHMLAHDLENGQATSNGKIFMYKFVFYYLNN